MNALTAIIEPNDIAEETDDFRIGDLAAELLEKYGDINAATHELHRQAEADSVIYRAVVNGGLLGLCRDRIARAAKDRRSKVFPRAAGLTADEMRAWNEAAAVGIMETFVIPGGKKLGDALKEECLAGAQSYAIERDDRAIKSKFLTLVAEALKAGQSVREGLTEEKLQSMRSDARKIGAEQ